MWPRAAASLHTRTSHGQRLSRRCTSMSRRPVDAAAEHAPASHTNPRWRAWARQCQCPAPAAASHHRPRAYRPARSSSKQHVALTRTRRSPATLAQRAHTTATVCRSTTHGSREKTAASISSGKSAHRAISPVLSARLVPLFFQPRKRSFIVAVARTVTAPCVLFFCSFALATPLEYAANLFPFEKNWKKKRILVSWPVALSATWR